MNMTLMAAADLEWGIGIDAKLPWHVPEDLKRFRERTMGKTVVMGRKTVETLPSSLPGRRIITLTRTPMGFGTHDLGSLVTHFAGHDEEIIAAGGGEVYRALLPVCKKAEITRIKGVYKCDTHLPDLREHGWTQVSSVRLSDISDIEEWRPL